MALNVHRKHLVLFAIGRLEKKLMCIYCRGPDLNPGLLALKASERVTARPPWLCWLSLHSNHMTSYTTKLEGIRADIGCNRSNYNRKLSNSKNKFPASTLCSINIAFTTCCIQSSKQLWYLLFEAFVIEHTLTSYELACESIQFNALD